MRILTAWFLVSCFCIFAVQAQIPHFEHIVIIVQENRTPDNLFQGLCSASVVRVAPCSTIPTRSQYNIQTTNWLDKTSPTGVTQPKPVALAGKYDLGHYHGAFVDMCDVDSTTGTCRNDGTAIKCSPAADCPAKPQFAYVDNSTGEVDPYLNIARQYGSANFMFQTNQGPSFPAHQFLFGGTSAPTAADDAAGTFVSENTYGVSTLAGCAAPVGTTVLLITADGKQDQEIYPCSSIRPCQISCRPPSPGDTIRPTLIPFGPRPTPSRISANRQGLVDNVSEQLVGQCGPDSRPRFERYCRLQPSFGELGHPHRLQFRPRGG